MIVNFSPHAHTHTHTHTHTHPLLRLPHGVVDVRDIARAVRGCKALVELKYVTAVVRDGRVVYDECRNNIDIFIAGLRSKRPIELSKQLLTLVEKTHFKENAVSSLPLRAQGQLGSIPNVQLKVKLFCTV